jgi:hypothetical protein
MSTYRAAKSCLLTFVILFCLSTAGFAGEKFQIIANSLSSMQQGSQYILQGTILIADKTNGKIYLAGGMAIFQSLKEPYVSLKVIYSKELSPVGQYSTSSDSDLFTSLPDHSEVSGPPWFNQIWRVRENARVATWCVGQGPFHDKLSHCFETKF